MKTTAAAHAGYAKLQLQEMHKYNKTQKPANVQDHLLILSKLEVFFVANQTKSSMRLGQIMEKIIKTTGVFIIVKML